MLIEEKYPHLANPTKAEWRVVAVRSAVFILLCILISALAHLFGASRKKPQNAAKNVAQSAASTRDNIFYSPSTAQSGKR